MDKELIPKRPKDVDHSLFVLIELGCGIFVAEKNQSDDFGLLNQSLDDVTVFVYNPLGVSLLDAEVVELFKQLHKLSRNGLKP